MDDALSSLATAPCGYRLHKLELMNWGTFDSARGTVHTVRPVGATTLLIGQNGSGKSTLVDALLTLLVRPVVRNYNVAAGAHKQERDEKTYVRGAYGRFSRDEDNRAEVQFLRPGNNHYAALLACFRNDRNEAFTLAQVLYLNAEGGSEKVYCFAAGEKSIAEDCAKLATSDRVRQQLEKRGFKATDKYIEYHAWLTRQVAIRPKAMDMFNQTVAVKDIQSLNRFIREHMLEAQPWAAKIDTLQAHFTQLTEAHQSLVRVRRQSTLLAPIAEKGATYLQQASELAKADSLWKAAGPYFRKQIITLFVPVVEAAQGQLAELDKSKATIDADTETSRENIRHLKNEIEQAGGERLKEIPLLIANHKTEAKAKRERHDRFQAALAASGLQQEVIDAFGLDSLRGALPQHGSTLKDARRSLQLDRDRRLLARGETNSQLAEDRREFQALGNRQTKLPESHAEVRRQLSLDLRIPEIELPFVAELISVAPEERSWEASIEMVLRGFALSLLVPNRHYGIVSSHIDRNRVRDERGRGQRLTYFRVSDRTSLSRPRPVRHTQSLLQKLRLRDGHSLLPWLKGELDDRFDYLCCNTIEEFQSAHDLALTRERHVKMRGVRHEKDDRDRTADPRNFILGWDNKEKRQHLSAEIERLTIVLNGMDRELTRLDAELTGLDEKMSAVSELERTSEFATLDYAAEEKEIASLLAEKQALEEGNETVRMLRQRIADLEAHQTNLQQKRDEVIRTEQRLTTDIAFAQRQIREAREAIAELERHGELAAHAAFFTDLDACFTSLPLAAVDVVQRERPFVDQKRASADALRQGIDPLRNDLCGLMNRYLREFADERADLEGAIEYLGSFSDVFEQLCRDDLPRYEKRFKERLNEKVVQEMGLLNGAFQTERTEIESKIDLLNRSLRQLEYQPGTYMRLEARPVRDAEISDFQVALRECLAGTFEGTLEADEARYLRIEKLLARLREDPRWRDKVTDVRRWFDFAAQELTRDTGAQRNYYEDSTGQSGGEKAKLAFTILVAAIAYQYDIDPERPESNRFHFVVVDEMFSKVDDRYSQYALELFRKFGLQILIVAPLDAKARVTEPYVECYLHVVKDAQTHCSEIFSMTAREFEETIVSRNGEHAAQVAAALV